MGKLRPFETRPDTWAGDAADGACDFDADDCVCRRGKETTAVPCQSFQVSVARGATGGRPSKGTSNAAKLTSLPTGSGVSTVRNTSSWTRSKRSAMELVVPEGTR